MSTEVDLIEGRKGKGGGRSAVEAKDTLRSTQIAEVVDLISEGECQGLANGLESVYLDGVPLKNPDGTFNFTNVDVSWSLGTQGQPALAGMQGVQTETAVGVQVDQANPVIRTITDPAIDRVRVTIAVPQLSKQNTENGDLNGSRFEWAIEIQSAGGGFVERFRRVLDGKTMSQYTTSVVIELFGAAPWDVRVRRVSPDSTTSNEVNRFTWASYTSIQSIKLRYPNSAVVRTTVNAAQFSSVPVRSYDWLGKRVLVPENYNPHNLSYTGTWSGQFKVAWTANPAWVFYDLLTNQRYGLGRYIDPSLANKWALYRIAQYCDELVPDGQGGTEPRFQCHCVLSSREEALTVLRDLAAVFRGMVWWGGASVEVSQDAPQDPMLVYTPSNVVDGNFSYQDTSERGMHSVFICYWNDWSQQGKRIPETYAPTDLLQRYGMREIEITPIGVASRGQAARVCRWARHSEQLEDETVTFRVGSEGQVATPGKLFKIADPNTAGERLGGRIKAATISAIQLDAPVTLANGETYTITVLQPDADDIANFVTEKRTVITSAGPGQAVLEVSPSFSAAPAAGTVWLLESTGISATLWRCFSVEPVKDSNEFDISGVAHNAGKFDAIELGLTLDEPATSRMKVTVLPPTSLEVIETVYDSGGVNLSRLTVSWVPSAQGLRHQVSWRQDSGWWQRLPETTEQTVDIPGLAPGVYEVTVSSSNALGAASPSVLRSITLQGGPSGIRALRLSASSLVFRVAADGSVQPGHIDLVLDQGALVGQVDWQVSAGLTLSGSGAVRSLAAADMTVDSGTVSVLLTERGRTYSDQVTILKLRDGLKGDPGTSVKGEPGKDGTSAISASLTLDTIALPADGNGAVTSYAGAQSSLVVFSGVDIDTDNWTFTETHTAGVTPVLNANQVVVQGMSDSVDVAYVDVTATRPQHASITKRITVSKLKTGPKGQDGDPGLRGTVTLAAVTTGTSWSDSAANQALVDQGYGVPVNLDFVTLYNSDAGFSEARFRSNGAWLPVQAYIHGNMVLDGTMGVRSLVVQGGVGGSLWTDPNVIDKSAWKFAGVGVGLPEFVTIVDGVVGGSALRGGAGGASIDGWPLIAVSPKKAYRLSFFARSLDGADGKLSARYVWSTSPKGVRNQVIPTDVQNVYPGAEWARYSLIFYPTAGVSYVSPRLLLNIGGTVGSHEVQDVRIEELIDSALVVQGGITTDRLNVRSLSEFSSDLGVISTGRLDSDVLFSGKISAGSIDVQKLSGTSSIYGANGEFVLAIPSDFSTVKLTIRAAGGGAGRNQFARDGSTWCGGGGGQGGLTVIVLTNVQSGTTVSGYVGKGGRSGGYVISGRTTTNIEPASGENSRVTVAGSTFTAYGGLAGGNAGLSGSSYFSGDGGAGGNGGGSGGSGSNGGAGARNAQGVGGGVSGANGSGASSGTGSSETNAPDGSILVEAYNSNGVVLRQEWSTLIGHLNTRLGGTWP
jgi:hypothetical protein